ncbi:MAG: Mrp/NBP35 family ATP-binding protein [Bacteroidales bacterium]
MDIKSIEESLKKVIHPEKEEDIVSLGMVEEIKFEDGRVKFKLIFPSPDPLSTTIKRECERILRESFPNHQFKLSIMELVRERKFKKRAHLNLDQQTLAHVDKIIAIASGKGGVGKSTLSVNLAIALAKAGYKVGLTDADVYGPSIPKMTGSEEYKPMIDDSSGKDLILPMEKWGVKWISIGYFAKPEQPMIWRGPMASTALKQMVLQVAWGELDYLLVDLPPGTGDVHISLVSDIPLSGAVIVSTPQSVALADVEKGINMFMADSVKKPILGLVENMAWFTPAELPNNRYYIFGKDGCKEVAQKYQLPILGEIPLIQSIREGGDDGEPIALSDGEDGKSFHALAQRVIEAAAKLES